jgi:ubiquitin carboxyl-terminal hydrolase L3
LRFYRAVVVAVFASLVPFAMSAPKQQRWFPLESNPKNMNDYVKSLGLDTSVYSFTDVFSTEDWALSMVPQPVAAVVLLYPLSDKQEAAARANDQVKSPTSSDDDSPEAVWFTKQRIGNACGTIGLLHAVLNAPPDWQAALIQRCSWLEDFRADCPPAMDPLLKAERLEGDSRIAKLHDEATRSETNATDRGSLDDRINTHFVSLVHRAGRLYELDGRKEGPVDHGATTPATLLKDAIAVVQTFMQRDPGELRFTILALAPTVE